MAQIIEDWTKHLVPRVNDNSSVYGRSARASASMRTTDLVSLPTYFELKEQDYAARSLTDFGLLTNGYQYLEYEDRAANGKPFGGCQSRTSGTDREVFYLHWDHSIGWGPVNICQLGLCPELTLKLPEGVSNLADVAREIGPIRERKFPDGQTYYTIELGEYPRTKVSPAYSKQLENLYHGGKLCEGLECTGRLFTTNAQRDYQGDFLSQQNPEFRYHDKKYIRMVFNNDYADLVCEDGSKLPNKGVAWVHVEPMIFRIQNATELLNGTAKVLNLSSDELILSGIPFYPRSNDANCTLWQNSLERAFLNSADSRLLDGNPQFKAPLQWDFRQSGFLHQALDMTREPTRVYTVPATETRIADYALAGCVGLEKIIIPEHVTRIGQHAFDGCVNAQIIVQNRNLVLPQNKRGSLKINPDRSALKTNLNEKNLDREL